MALNRSDKSRILRRYFPGMTRNSEMSTEPSITTTVGKKVSLNAFFCCQPTRITALQPWVRKYDFGPRATLFDEPSL